MGFMDKIKEGGKKALKILAVSANDWCGQVSIGKYNGMDLAKCLVATDSKDSAVVFYKGVNEVCRIPTSKIAVFKITADIEHVSARTLFSFKDDNENVISIHTKFNDGKGGTKAPGVYFDTRGNSYIKFIDFLRENTMGTNAESEIQLETITDLVKKLNQINKNK